MTAMVQFSHDFKQLKTRNDYDCCPQNDLFPEKGEVKPGPDSSLICQQFK